MGQKQRRDFSNRDLQGVPKSSAIDFIPSDIFFPKSGMGSDSMGSSDRYKQQSDGKLVISNISGGLIGTAIKRVCKMAETKLVVLLLNWLGIPYYAYITFLYIETWKGWILLAIGAAYGIARVTFYVIRQTQEAKSRKLDLERKRLELDKDIEDGEL